MVPRARARSFSLVRKPTGNALIDATNDEALAATFDHWYDGYGRFGVKAMWMDESEPDHAAYISGGQWKLAKGIDAELLPAWVHAWSRGFAEAAARDAALAPGEFFLLSRNAWLGTAHHGAALWSGDVASDFEELALQVKAGQQAGLSGIPLW